MGGEFAIAVKASARSSVSAGSFKEPMFAIDGTTCVGVRTVDGTEYPADKVVLAAGAWTPVLVDLEDQCISKVSQSALASDTDPTGLGIRAHAAVAR